LIGFSTKRYKLGAAKMKGITYLILPIAIHSAAVAEDFVVHTSTNLSSEPSNQTSFFSENTVSVIDGDTISVNGVNYRLSNIDAPEECQPYGDTAKRQLASALTQRHITFEFSADDTASLTLFANGRNVNQELVLIGSAWAYGAYQQEQTIAQQNEMGLWGHDPNPMPPWDWSNITTGGCATSESDSDLYSLAGIEVFTTANPLPDILERPSLPPNTLISVDSGDGIAVEGVRALLSDIDAPAACQPYGENSKQRLASLLSNSHITYELHGQDAGRRFIVTLFADGRNVNEEMVLSGAAWNDTHAYDGHYADAQTIAQALRVGLWGNDQDPMPPWRWSTLIQAEQPNVCSHNFPINEYYARLYGGGSTAVNAGTIYPPENIVLDSASCENFRYQEDAQLAFVSGNQSLDADGDGQACEWLTSEVVATRSPSPIPVGATATPLNPRPTGDIQPSTDPRCNTNKTCASMQSCQDAQFYFNQCGMDFLDADNDGIPCEELCLAP
jgi:endonuclease YncB( thermonuclease family)